MTLRLIDLDHAATALGGMPSEHDHCQVVDDARQVRNPLTGAMQPVCVYAGTRADCARVMGALSGTYNPTVGYSDNDGFGLHYTGPFGGLVFPSPEAQAEARMALACTGRWSGVSGTIVVVR